MPPAVIVLPDGTVVPVDSATASPDAPQLELAPALPVQDRLNFTVVGAGVRMPAVLPPAPVIVPPPVIVAPPVIVPPVVVPPAPPVYVPPVLPPKPERG